MTYSNIHYRNAKTADIAQLLKLEQQHLNDELSQAGSMAANMMQGQALTKVQLTKLIDEHVIAIAELRGEIIGYVIAADWSFYTANEKQTKRSQSSIYQYISAKLPELSLDGRALTTNNSCQYGPIWVAPSVRGAGVFQKLVEYLCLQLTANYDYLVAYIAEDNERSFAAHTNKANMQVIDFISYQQSDYYLLARATNTEGEK
ncbi:GNAT family N-acetyltransferase [Shewanella maritima]|uniref:GNAT family N-acetyltransferase n=1 Tax=Shewanella maritima TaxID=2520507 RepID=A0A411PJI4_9GAMM|nr:GNAT family N-acetyltransferase [Shewanella maritima]QBF83648.1 GNAT family N-acetyltransferase [Shewanella maritima]